MKVGTSVLAFCYLSFVAFAKEDVGSIIGDQQVTDPVSVGDNSILNYYGGSNYFFSNNIQVGRGALYIGKESFFSSSQNAGKDDDGTFSFLVKYTNNLQNNGQFTIDSVKRDSDSCGNTNIELYPTNFQNDGTFEIITGGSEGTCCKPSTIVAPQNFLNNGNFFYKVTTGTGSILYNSCRQELVVGTSTKITVNNNLWQYSGSVNAQINGPVSGSAQINLDGSNMFVNTNTFSGQVVNLINGGSFIQTSDPLSNNVVINGLGTAVHTITTIAVKGMGKGFTYNPATGIVKLSTTDGRTYSYQIGCGYDPTKLSAKDVTGSFYDTSGQYFMLTYSEEYKPHTCDPGNTSIYSSEVHEETSSTISIHTSTISSSTTHTFSIPPPYTTTRLSGSSIIDTEIVSFYSTTDSPGHTITGTTTTTLYGPHTHSSVSTPSSSSESSTTSNSSIESSSLPHTSVSSTPESSITPSSNTISSSPTSDFSFVQSSSIMESSSVVDSSSATQSSSVINSSSIVDSSSSSASSLPSSMSSSSSSSSLFIIPPPYTTTRSSGSSIIDTEIVSFYSTTDSPGHTITGTTTTTLYGPHTHSSVSTPSSSSESSTTSNSSIESSSLPHTSVSSTPESSITPSSNTISSSPTTDSSSSASSVQSSSVIESSSSTVSSSATQSSSVINSSSIVDSSSSSSSSLSSSMSSSMPSSMPSSSSSLFIIPPPYTTTRLSGSSIIDTEIVSFYSTTDSPGHTITGTTTTTLYESSIYSSSSSTIQESELSNTSRTTMTSNSSVSISSTSSRSSSSNTKSSTIVISQSASLPDSKTDIILSTSSNIGYSSRSLLSDLGTSISDSDIHHSVLHSTESYSSNESGTNPFTSIASLSNFIPESSSHTSTALGSENSVISSDILTTMSHPVATNSGDKPTTPKRSEQVSTTMTSSGPTPDTSSFDTDGMSAYSRPEFTTNSLEVNKSSTSQLGNNKQTFSNLQLESTRPHSENEVDNNTRLLQSIQQSSTYGTNNVNTLSPTGSISIPLTEDGQGENNNWNSPATNDLCTQISFNLTATTITVTDRITITDSIHDVSSEVITSYIYQTIVDQKTVTQTVDGKSLANKMSSIPKPSSRSLIQPQPPIAIELQEGAASTSRVSLVSLFISIILVLL
ncbi:hypothetical protein B1J92_J11891g1 [Nakaseomyces glabratus]|nr:hypothetical protein B1J91_J11891g1 [Nakaseomyces glabratus]OXB47682.1 hypothetical protein B1J92_J11891g1 [Nakaseomyces glabratus]